MDLLGQGALTCQYLHHYDDGCFNYDMMYHLSNNLNPNS
jgi:hypothetical protein